MFRLINCENFTWSMCSGSGSIRSVIMWDFWIRIWNTGFIYHFQKWNNLTIFFFKSCRKGSRMKGEKAALQKCIFFCAKRRIQIRSDFRFRSGFRSGFGSGIGSGFSPAEKGVEWKGRRRRYKNVYFLCEEKDPDSQRFPVSERVPVRFGSGIGSGFGSGSGPKSPWLKYILDEGFCLKYKGYIC
jgi:hypothetical protein